MSEPNKRYVNWLDLKLKQLEYQREGMYASSGMKNRVEALPKDEKAARKELFVMSIRRLNEYKTNTEMHPQLATTQYDGIFYRTQKATGMMKQITGRGIPGVITSTQPYYKVLPYDMFEFSMVNVNAPQVVFARPAPTRPRHGFVESREVHGYVDLLDLYREALTQDEHAEVIVMERLTGEFSAVANNAGVTWGFGNDGVTGGTSGVFIPSQVPVATWNDNSAGSWPESIGIKNVCYLELVQNRNTAGEEVIQVVQRRDGPAQETSLEYIPREIKVTKVLKPHHYNLLDWEKKIKEHAGTEGAVVWQHDMPLSSHFAVHAIEHGIPVLTGYSKPELGSVIKPTNNVIPPLTDVDTVQLSKDLKRWMRTPITPAQAGSISKAVLATSIATIHSMSRWGNAPQLLNLRAFGVSMMLRYLHSALAGELRHWDQHGPGLRYDEDGNRVKAEERRPRTKLKSDRRVGDSRLSIYMQYLKAYSVRARLEHLNTMYEDFGDPGWDGQYGGRNWQNVAHNTISLAKAVLEFQADTSPAKWRDVVVAANTALHTAHNNGLAVTKWLPSNSVSRLAIAPTIGFLNPIAARVALNQPLVGKVEQTDEWTDDISNPDRELFARAA